MAAMADGRQRRWSALLAALSVWACTAGVATGAPPAYDEPDRPAAGNPWRAMMLEDDPARRERLIPAVLKTVESPEAARRLIKADAAFDATNPGRFERMIAFTDPVDRKSYKVRFLVVSPPGYSPDKPWPMLLAAHGQHGDGRSFAHTALRLLGRDADKYIVVAPTMPGAREFSGKSYQEQAYLQPLAWVRRHMNVDADRVYIAGYSQGGHCTWHLAALFPRRFAAAVAMAGTPWFEGSPHTNRLYLGNLSNLPLWSIWGELDKPEPPAIGQAQFNQAAAKRLEELGNRLFRATELRGVGHSGCTPQPRQFAAFLAGAKRNPAPETFSHDFHLRHHARGYYIEAISLAGTPMRMDRPVRIRFGRPPTREESDRKMEEHFRKYLYGLAAELDREANTLSLKLRRVRAVRIHVLDGLFDLTQPVTIKIGTRRWRGEVNASAECMIRHYAEDRDRSAVVVNELEMDYTGRVRVKYEQARRIEREGQADDSF